MSYFLLVLIATSLAAAADAAVTVYTIAASRGNILLAALATGAIGSLKALAFLLYIEDHTLLIFTTFGEMGGTAFAVWYFHSRYNSKPN